MLSPILVDTSHSVPHADPRFDFTDDQTYRVFHLDKYGRVASAEIISAESDEQAIGIAQALQNGHGLELWERTRLLAHYPGSTTGGA